MMMLGTSALAAATATKISSIFSPSRNSCVKRVAPARFRYDPYSARVLMHETPLATVETPIKSVLMEEPHATVSAVPAITQVTVASPKPKASTARYAIVHFKHESITYHAPTRIAIGDTVVVEGDRGENIGTVLEITQGKPAYDVPGRVLRRATEKDLDVLADQRAREEAAMRATQSLADSLGLHATIEDVEYQFDLNKLTVFVRRSAKNAFVDFRKLQRGLFREFRCRIWCAYMDEIEAAEEGPRCR